jgi:hypothetical protein
MTGCSRECEAVPLPRFFPAQVVGVLAFLLIMARTDRWPLADRWRDPAKAMAALAVASVTLFLLAHALLFDLYLPNRYTAYTLRLLTALAAGFAAVIMVARVGQRRRWAAGAGAIALAAFVLSTTAIDRYPGTLYVTGKAERVYEALARRPPGTLTASIASEASNIPTFAQRPVLASQEYALAYHTRYYGEIVRRLNATVRAQYAPAPVR